MYNVDSKQLVKVMKQHYDRKIPLFIYGGYGVGKSELVKQTAKEIAKQKNKELVFWDELNEEEKQMVEKKPKEYFVVIDNRLSNADPTDVKGIPNFNDEHKREYLNWVVDRYLKLMTKPDADGIMFFDEMNQAPPSVLNGFFKIFHDRKINDEKLNDNVSMIACGNRLCLTANTWIRTKGNRERDNYKRIYALKKDDEVLSFNEKTKEFEYCKVTATNKRKVYQREIVRLQTQKGNVLEGTTNHPVLTKRGWVELGQLVRGDVILEYPDFDYSKLNSRDKTSSVKTHICKACGKKIISNRTRKACNLSCVGKLQKGNSKVGHPQTKETRDKISQTLKDKITPERRKAISERTKKMWTKKGFKQAQVKKISASLCKSEKHQTRMKEYYPNKLMMWRKENPAKFKKSSQKGAVTTRKLFSDKNIISNLERTMSKILTKNNTSFKMEEPIYDDQNRLISIADFKINNKPILIYCDGEYWHKRAEAIARDRKQTKKLEKAKYKVLRFWGEEIMNNQKEVIEKIMNCVINGEKVVSIDRSRRTCFVYDISVAKNHNFIANGLITHNCDKAHVHDMPNPLRDRMSEVELVFNSDNWFEWAMNNDIDHRLIIFLKFKPSYLNQIVKDRDVKDSTPRGITQTSILIKDVEDDEVKPFVCARLGEGFGMEMASFLKLNKKINIADLMRNPKKVENITETDLKFSVVSGVTEYYKKDEKKHIEACSQIAEYMQTEFAILLLKLMKATNESFFKQNIVKTKNWNKLATEFGKYLLD